MRYLSSQILQRLSLIVFSTLLFSNIGFGQASLVVDANTSTPGSNISQLIEFDGALYFQADSETGKELWKWDTINGKERLSDINPGSEDANPAFLTEYKDDLYFSAYDGTSTELWKYDGTAVSKISSINSTGNSQVTALAVAHDTLYFSAANSGSNTELWQYDGTAVKLAAEIAPGTTGSRPLSLCAYNDTLYFGANPNDGTGQELWKYDGTTASMVEDVYVGSGQSFPGNLTVADGQLYYFGRNASNQPRIFRYDGTTIHDMATASGSGGIGVYNGGVYYTVGNSSNNGHVYRIQNHVSVQHITSTPFAAYYTEHDGKLYFRAYHASYSYEIWEYNGTSTQVLDGYTPGPSSSISATDMVSYGDKLYFSATGTGIGKELMQFDSTAISVNSGISVAADINSDETNNGTISSKILYNGDLYFYGIDSLKGGELMKWDGNNLTVLWDLAPGGESSGIRDITEYNGDLYFSATEGYNVANPVANELYKWNGDSISLVADIRVGGQSGSPSQLAVHNGLLYFRAYDGNLWQTDGTTTMLTVDVSSFYDNVYYLTSYNGKLYFSLQHETYRTELFSWDGTSATLEHDFVSGTGSGSPSNLYVHNGHLYMTARSSTSSSSNGVYKYDGTTMTLIHNLGSAYVSEFTSHNGDLYFAIPNSNLVYKYDGTSVTTSFNNVQRPQKLTSLQGRLYMESDNTTKNAGELWMWNDTTATLVEDLWPGTSSSSYSDHRLNDFIVWGDTLFFTAKDTFHGTELWKFIPGPCTLKQWYVDADGDGYGSGDTLSCGQPANGYLLADLVAGSTGSDDCDDADPDEFPGQTWYIDLDGDTYGSSSTTACERPTNGLTANEIAAGSTGTDDCDDTDDTILGPPIWYADTDMDTYGDPNSTLVACSQPSGYVANNSDCDDTDAEVNPTTVWYIDEDGDGFGTPDSTMMACLQPEGFGADSTDCDDNDAGAYPGQTWYFDDDNDGYGGSDTISCLRPVGAKTLCELDCATGSLDSLHKFVTSDRAYRDYLGRSIATSGDYAIVATLDDSGGSDAGAAYIFKRSGDTWIEQAKLIASDAQSGDYFGQSVSIDGDYAIVGAFFEDAKGSSAGAAYIFKRNGTTWTEVQKLTASDGSNSDSFGNTVSISGNYAVVGTRYAEAAYVFYNNGSSWTEQQILTASDGASSDYFGWSVDIDGDKIVVGAWQEDPNNTSNAGSAYIFKRSGTTWSEEAKLFQNSRSSSDNLGYSVALSGDIALIGVRYDGIKGYRSGSAVVFEYDGTSWTQKQVLTASNGNSDDQFSHNLSLHGDNAIIGAWNRENGSFGSAGAAYIFKNDGGTWSETKILNQPNPASSDYFGWEVAVGDTYAFIGSYNEDGDVTNQNAISDAGAFYVEQIVCSPDLVTCTGTDDCDDTDANLNPGNIWYIDNDGDGFGNPDTTIMSCLQPTGYALNSTDCDDTDSLINPTTLWYPDADGDGYGVPGTPIAACLQPAGYGIDTIDCDDADANAYPNQTWYFDEDSDGYGGRDTISCLRPTNAYTICELSCATDALDSLYKIVAGDREASDEFGNSIAISGDYAIVGARFEDPNSLSAAGAAYIFKRSGASWTQEVKLVPSDAQSNDYFGQSVSIDGDYAIVGAYGEDARGSSAGAAYIFKRSGSTWTEVEKITASNGGNSDYFGYSVSISGDYAVVGAYREDTRSSDAGAVYIFHNNGTSWVQQQMLTASDGAYQDYFGWSVSISGDKVLIGAYREDPSYTDAGAAYIFKRTGTSWSQEAKLIQSSRTHYDYFGESVSLSGDDALIGTRFDDVKGSNSGSAVLFNYNGSTWTQQQVLLASNGAANDYFGSSVSILNEKAIVGAYNKTIGGFGTAGAAYVFEKDGATWSETEILTNSNPASSDHFGWSVATGGNSVLVGSIYEDEDETNQNSLSNAGAFFAKSLVCSPDLVTCTGTDDCDDSDADANPETVWYADSDGDGYGNPDSTTMSCLQPIGFVSDSSDYNDSDSTQNPQSIWYIDLDGDGYGDADSSITSPFPPAGYSTDSTDCDDMDALEFPGQIWYFDTDNDGWGSGDTISCERPVGAVSICELTCATEGIDSLYKMVAGDRAASDEFGNSIVISGDYAIVGARYEDPNNISNAGAAYIFKRSGASWTQEAKLIASDPQNSDYFGESVSISGDYAIVGAYGEDTRGSTAGAAYIFKRSGSTWTEVNKLTASNGGSSDQFGWSVSISGNYAAVGAWQEDTRSSNAGAAYIYFNDGTNWTQQQMLTASDGSSSDYFGYSVSVSGDKVLVGAYGEDPSYTNAGSAYVFKRTGTSWSQEAKIFQSSRSSYDEFGYSVSLSGDNALIGARYDDVKGSNSGSAVLFNYDGSTWTQQQVLSASNGTSNDYFGSTVSLFGDKAIVGSYNKTIGGFSQAGAAYVYETDGTTWSETDIVTNSNPASSDYLGWSVAIGENALIVGSPREYQDAAGQNTLSIAGAFYAKNLGCIPEIASCAAQDCDDNDANEFPGQVWYFDGDADGYGGGDTISCERPVGLFALNELSGTGLDDCDDDDDTVYPNAPEICDDKDNDCNGVIDDGAAPVVACPDSTVLYVDVNCGGTVPDLSGLATVTDDCDTSFTFSQSFTSYTYSDINVILTVTDSAALSTSCQIIVHLVDTIRPVLACPSSQVIPNSPGSCNQQTSWPTVTATDNCAVSGLPSGNAGGVFIIETGNVAFALFPQGTTTVTYTVTDINSNVGTCSFDVTVNDVEAPTLVGCPTSDVNATTDPDECGAQVGWTPIYPDDNCSATLEFSHTPGDFFPVGMTPVIYIATDPGNLKDTCEFNVVVQDVTPPVVTCISDTTYLNLDSTGIITLNPLDFELSTMDNCDNITHQMLNPTLGCSDLGLQEVILIANDNNQLYDSCSAFVFVTDDINPTASCIDTTLIVVLDANGMATITPADIDDNSSDNCSIASMSLDSTAFDCMETGLNSVNLTVTDASGNSAACSADVNVIDNTNPMAVCIDTVMQLALDANGMISITADDIDNGSSDNCSFSMTIDSSGFDCKETGYNVVNLTVTDASSNSAACSATVHVSDNISPTAICIDTVLQLVLDANGMAMITANDIDDGSFDNCDFTMVIDTSTFDCMDLGMHTITLTATDNISTSSSLLAVSDNSCTAQVNVSDNMNPMALCITSTLDVILDANGMATITTADIDDNSSDNCSIASMTLDSTAFDCMKTGLNSVNLTVTDASGNSANCSADVNVIDNTNPTAVCIDTVMQLALDANGMAMILASDIDDGSNDNCSFSMALDSTAFDCMETGMNTVNLTVTDASGNSAACSADVNVIDNSNPMAICIDTTMQISLDANGMAMISANDIDNGSNDNCTFSMSLDSTAFDCMETGMHSVNLTVTDASGNSAACSATVNVSDDMNPDAQCISSTLDVILDANGMATITTADIDDNSSDNCSIASMALDSTAFDCMETGMNTVNLTVTDASGNSAACSADVNVIDNTNPMAVCIDTVMQLALDANGIISITADDIDNGSSDNCSFSMTIDSSGFDCKETGYNVVNLTVTDASSNTAACTATVHVSDNISPTAICIDTVMQLELDANGMAMITADDIDDGSFDNCDFTMAIDTSTFDCMDLGMHTITLTATDNISSSSSLVAVSGNSCTAQVNVSDNMNPTAQCITSTLDVILDANGIATITTTDIDNNSSDNCSIASMSLDSTAFDCMETGLNSVNLTVTDASGNSANCSADVNVIDNSNPMAVCIDTVMQLALDANGMATILARDIDDGSNDNCSFSMALDSTAFNCMETGLNSVNLTVTDASGNSAACSADVNVVDDINPTANCIASTLEIYVDANGKATIRTSDINDGSFDNCSITMMELDSTTFDCSEAGMNTVNLTVTDASSNTSMCSATVNVLDTIAPINLTCPDDMSISSTSTSCQGSAGWLIPTWSDNCSVSDVQFSAPGASVFPLGANAFGTFPGGTTTVSYTAVDNGGNSTVCSFDIIVTDQVFPTFAGCPSTVNAVSTAGQCSAQVFWSPPSASDNCPGYMVSQSHFPAQIFDVGTTTVTYTVTDVSDNTAHCTFDVVVTDGTAPTLTCPSDITVTAPSGSCNVVVNFANPTATDDCDDSVIPVHVEGPASGTPVNIGTSSSYWTATDSAGNSVNCNISITVLSGDVWYADLDGDGFGDDATSQTGCIQPANYVAVGGDCDDSDATVNPDATDICDGIDNDCDGVIDNLNGCERPTTITALPLTNTTATITWTAMCGATKYDLRYRPFVPGVTVRHVWHKDLTSNTFDLENLTYGTIYQVQVRTHCGTGVSTFRTVYITTEATPSCVTPVFTTATAGATTIDLAWPEVGATFYRIMWKEHGSGSWNIADFPAGTTSYQITGLNPNTKYRYMIRVKCGGPWAPFNAFNLITTDAAPPSMGRTGTEKPIATMRAYPNPFQDGFRIETDMVGMKQISIMSSQGRLLSTWKDDKQSIRIDMAGMPSGLYIIELKDKNGSILRERMVKTDR